MYKNSYQYGKHVALFNIQNKDSLKQWGFQGTVKKAYDKSCKSFILVLDHSTKATIPEDPRSQELYLVQPFIMLQLMVTNKKVFHIEIVVTDQQKTKRRLFFHSSQGYSYSKDNIVKQPLHARIPCDFIVEGIWLNLQFDIQSYIERCFGQFNFRSIDAITISGSCRLRKVLTMKQQIPDSTSLWIEREYGEEIASEFSQQFERNEAQTEDLPGNLNFGVGVEYLNQVISYDRIVFWGYLVEQMNLMETSEGGHYKGFKPKIAFGSRVTDKPVIESKQQIQTVQGSINKIKKQYSPSKIIQGSVNEGILNCQSSPDSSPSKFRINPKLQAIKQGQLPPQPPTRLKSFSGFKGDESFYPAPPSNLTKQGSAYTGVSNSPNRSQLPRGILGGGSIAGERAQSREDSGNIDFSQYQVTSNLQQNLSLTKINSTKQTAQIQTQRFIKLKNSSTVDDDHSLNEKIKYLNIARGQIDQIALRYGLQNEVKIEKLTLLTVYNANRGGYHGDPKDQLASSDPKERVKEYHERVNQKRRQIHEKQKQRKKDAAPSLDILDPQKRQDREVSTNEENEGVDSTSQVQTKLEDGAQDESTTKKKEMNLQGKVDGWEGEEGEVENEDYGKEEGEEAEGEEAEGEYGKEEGEAEEGGEGAGEDYGAEEEAEEAAEEEGEEEEEGEDY